MILSIVAADLGVIVRVTVVTGPWMATQIYENILCMIYGSTSACTRSVAVPCPVQSVRTTCAVQPCETVLKIVEEGWLWCGVVSAMRHGYCCSNQMHSLLVFCLVLHASSAVHLGIKHIPLY